MVKWPAERLFPVGFSRAGNGKNELILYKIEGSDAKSGSEKESQVTGSNGSVTTLLRMKITIIDVFLRRFKHPGWASTYL